MVNRALLYTGIGLGGIILAYLLIPKGKAVTQPTAVATITLNADKNSGQAPLTVNFSGQALDSNGNGVPNATLYLFLNDQNQGSFVTDSNGNYQTQVTFDTPGSYTVYVSDNSGGT